MPSTLTLRSIAHHIGAQIHDTSGTANLDAVIIDLVPSNRAGAGMLTFLTNAKYKDEIKRAQPSAVIVNAVQADMEMVQLVHPNAQAAMAKAAQLFDHKIKGFAGQSPLAYVHPSAKVASSAVLYPFCYIEADAVIGERTQVYPQVYVGAGANIGQDCVLFPGAVLMDATIIGDRVTIHGNSVIGSDGFGFAPTATGIEKIPQRGHVRIDNDVEVGALNSIDRATFDETHLSKGCKLDSHVHVAHNVDLGEYSMLCGFAGIAGSSKVGKRYIGAGQSGVSSGLTVGDNVILGAAGALIHDIDKPGEYQGFPAQPSFDWRRQVASLKQLPGLIKKIRLLEQEIEQLKLK